MISCRCARRVMFACAPMTLSLMLLCPPAMAQAGDPMVEAKRLIDARDFQKAAALLAPLESARAGDPQFDYWLGVAYLETDQLERAASALERALLRNPEFDSARLELGRVYFRMGALDLAEHEFRRLLDRAPNAEGKKALDGYLAEIARLKAKQRFGVKGYIEAGAGRDNNLTSTTRDFGAAIENSFGIPGIEPTGNSIRRSAAFGSAALGADMLWRQTESRTLFASADLRWRGYRQFDEYDYLLADLNLGMQTRKGDHTYTFVLFGQLFRQDGAPVETLGSPRITNDRDAAGVQFEVRRDLNATNQLALGLGASTFRYSTNKGQDTDQVLMSIAWTHRPSFWRGTTLTHALTYTHDDARRTLNDFSETRATRHATAFRVTLASDTAQRFSWNATLSHTVRIDDDQFARSTLVPIGRDKLTELTLRANWRTGEWMVQPYVTWLHNQSNISLYSFDKAEGGVSVRREFK
jgi:outer membrane protein